MFKLFVFIILSILYISKKLSKDQVFFDYYNDFTKFSKNGII